MNGYKNMYKKLFFANKMPNEQNRQAKTLWEHANLNELIAQIERLVAAN
jgi:hypothetical protein